MYVAIAHDGVFGISTQQGSFMANTVDTATPVTKLHIVTMVLLGMNQMQRVYNGTI